MAKKKHLTGTISTNWTPAQQQQAFLDKLIEWIWGSKDGVSK